MKTMQFYHAEVCPFAQRTLMCLLEKNLDFDHIEIDLRNKPDWFDDISPYSKVPVLKNHETLIYESSIINEYLDEAYPDPSLMPEAPGERATARIWIDFDNVKFIPAFYRVLLEQDLSKRQEIVDQLTDYLTFFENSGFASNWKGPYWLGRQISLVDLAIYPHFERIGVLEKYRNVGIPNSCTRLKEWFDAMRERPSAITTGHDEAYHVQAYIRYADGTASGTTAKDMRN